MYLFTIILMVLASLGLIGVVLIQSGKGDGLSGAFGMGEGQAVFGSRAGDVLTKATTWFAIAFMLLCLAVTYLSKHAGDSTIAGRGGRNYSASDRGPKPVSLKEYATRTNAASRVDGDAVVPAATNEAPVVPTAATNTVAAALVSTNR